MRMSKAGMLNRRSPATDMVGRWDAGPLLVRQPERHVETTVSKIAGPHCRRSLMSVDVLTCMLASVRCHGRQTCPIMD